ncbi:FadR/GntR family transcriptional regulator [Phenylobacterium montanum]|uniref:FadR family transcriptional regulator n=1 Tax=Phenylobacterium montanum TaxID=2823693 RepID=A0A975IX85_9CAUL|nr:FCD domain-containing protein [Caulobacter sp. S6]QUD90374.1 FadR family transcriptional regulator [Caulobacter sp. S6]
MPLRAKPSSAPNESASQTTRTPPTFATPRRASKTSEIVALEIVRNIVEQDLKPGDRLPLEAEMLKQYRVSRSSLREALRLLEVQGLIAIRPGPGAGTVVGSVHPGNLARTLTLYLHMAGSTYDKLLDAWMAAEPVLAGLAAKNPDRAKVREMMGPFVSKDHAEHGKWAIAEGLDFHDRIATLADNPVLALALQSISYISTEQVLTNPERSQLEEQIVHDHSELAEAIIAGKPDKAEKLMAEHIQHVVEDFKAYWPRRVGEKIQWR